MKKIIKIILFLFICLAVAAISVMSIDYYVQSTGRQYILQPDNVPQADAVLVLGAYVSPQGEVSDMLADRLATALEVYEQNKTVKFLVSGDHGQKDYDEVNAMKEFIKKQSIDSKDIFMDHAGFSTYESVYRARDIFKVKKLIIVTQEYHLMRAIFIARELGIEAYGVTADKHNYRGIERYKLREIAARNKDFFLAKFIRPEPTYLGDAIPISGDGRATDDRK